MSATDARNAANGGADGTDAEVRAFKVSPSIIRHLIESQAGSVEKAVLEAVMNGVDAGATRIDVGFDGLGGIVIEDDGRGFRTRGEIERHFEVFGFDHGTDEERKMERQIGRFGLGRGQLMAFAATKWETNEFEMNVDIRDKDLVFALTEHPAKVADGCRITARLYDDLTRVGMAETIGEIKRRTRYSPVAVHVDGKRANTDTDEVKWTTETDEFWFLARPESETGVDVYNLGIFVRRYPHHVVGVSGVLVSKPGHPFLLNMARNDVLQSTCPKWKAAGALLRNESRERRARERLCDADRIAIARDLVWGRRSALDYMRKPILKTVQGRHMTPGRLAMHAQGRVVVAPKRNSQQGEAAHREHLAAVLAPDVLDWYDADDTDGFVARLNAIWGDLAFPSFEAVGFEEATRAFSSDRTLVPRKAWTKMEAAGIKGLQRLSERVSRAVAGTRPDRGWQPPRKVLLGASDIAQAWTDGSKVIVVDRKYLADQLKRTLDGFTTLLAVFVHEYLHDEPDNTEHAHGPEFHEAFEEVMCGPGMAAFTFASDAHDAYRKARQAVGLTDTRLMATALDRADRVLA